MNKIDEVIERNITFWNSQSENYVYHYCENDDWSDLKVMEKTNGISFVRLYWFHEDESYICIDELGVNPGYRGEGYGKEIMEIAHTISDRVLKLENIRLWVVKDSWMKEWYERLGYEVYADGENNTVWMIKYLE